MMDKQTSSMDNRTSAEIANEIVERENLLTSALGNQYTVEQAILTLQRDILGLQSRKKDLEIDNSKAKHIVRKLQIEIKLLEKSFWKAKNSGL